MARLALIGNPNCGKTTIFNGLTGSRQKVANYPGVTVERREGRARRPGGREWAVLDLPGTYSLIAHSADERIACEAVLIERPDVVIAVVDATNLARNLYLVLQLLELGAPMVVALNMSDAAEAAGLRIDAAALEEALGVPVVPTVGPTREGFGELLDRAEELLERGGASDSPGASAPRKRFHLDYGPEIEKPLAALTARIEAGAGLESLRGERPPRWLALQLLGGDEATLALLRERAADPAAVFEAAQRAAQAIEEATQEDLDVALIGQRYKAADAIVARVMTRAATPARGLSERLDAVFTHRWLGLPIFLFLLWLVFQATFTIGAYPMDWVDAAFSWLGERLSAGLPAGLARSIVRDAVFGGVGGVLVFVPQILLLFFFMGLLEDSGYMARGAFLVDRLMRKLGLHGKSLIPLLLGFGCNIPGIMAARTLDTRRDRLVTILVSPMMNCSARLVVHTLLAAAFFPPRAAGHALFAIYLLGSLLAVGTAVLLRRTLFRGAPSPFVMEMPPYRFPSLRSVAAQMTERAAMYLKKAGTILLVFSILIWALCQFPRSEASHYDAEGRPTAEALRRSAAGRAGEAVAPALRPLGLDDWKIAIALMTGVVAKEVVVSSLGTVYSASDADLEAMTGEDDTALRERLAADPAMNPLRAFTLMVFVLLYVPCITTMAIMRRETNSWKWPVFSIVYLTSLAYLLSLLVFQVGRLLGWGA